MNKSRGTAKRRPGQAAGLSADQLAAEALGLVDEEGSDALTVRGLARRVGVEPMSLYNYFPNKEALMEAVWDQVIAEVDHAVTRRARDWQGFIREFGHRFRAVLLAHPKAMPIMLGRHARTPRSLQVVERALTHLVGFELDVVLAIDLLNTVSMFTMAHAFNEHETATAAPPAIDATAMPTLAAAMERGMGAAPGDDARRFTAAIDSLINGYAIQAAKGRRR